MKKKYTAKVDGKDVEVEISNEEILKQLTQEDLIEGIDTKEKGVLKSIMSKIGLNIKETPEDKKPETETKEEKVGADSELKGMLKELIESNKTLQAEMGEIKKKSALTEKEQTAKKLDSLLETAVKDGRIAKGERDDWEKKFEENYDGKLELFEELVNQRPIDEKLKTDNMKGTSGNKADDEKTGDPAGIPTFKTSQIRQGGQEFYDENRADIKKAYEAGTIIVDT